MSRIHFPIVTLSLMLATVIPVHAERSLQSAVALEQQSLSSYENGEFDRAYEGFLTLAEQGNKRSQHNLAALYYNGQGTARNLVEAAAWLTVAAEDGDAESADFLDAVLSELTTEERALYADAATDKMSRYSRLELDRRARSEARRKQSRNARMQAMFSQGSQRVHVTPRDIKSTACGSAREADIATCFVMKNQRGMAKVYSERRRVFTVLDNGGLDADSMDEITSPDTEVTLQPFQIVPDELDSAYSSENSATSADDEEG